jgi:general L-amino acid transport system substrate-binding protein
MTIKLWVQVLAAAGVVVSFAGSAQAGPTLDKVKQAGQISCGVQTGLAGFAAPDSQGRYAGLNVDICKALSAAIFGAVDKVKYVPLTAQQRFTALQSGEVDLLSNNTTDTLQRDTALGLNFAPVVFYDGQGFMVPKKLGIKNAKKLNGSTICVQQGTTGELNVADYFRSNKIEYKPVVIEKIERSNGLYSDAAMCTRRCFWSQREPSEQGAEPDDYVILPERISKEPLAPVSAPRRRRVERHRPGGLRAVRGRGKRDHLEECRRHAEERRSNIKRMLGVTPGRARRSGLTRNGPITRSSWSAITARSSTATSARIPNSNSSAA